MMNLIIEKWEARVSISGNEIINERVINSSLALIGNITYTRKTYFPDYIVYESMNPVEGTNIDGNNIGKIIHNNELQFALRTPLSTIIGLTEIVADEAEVIEEKEEEM